MRGDLRFRILRTSPTAPSADEVRCCPTGKDRRVEVILIICAPTYQRHDVRKSDGLSEQVDGAFVAGGFTKQLSTGIAHRFLEDLTLANPNPEAVVNLRVRYPTLVELKQQLE